MQWTPSVVRLLTRCVLVSVACMFLCSAAASAVRLPDPRIASISPFVGNPGSSAHIRVRGLRLEHARGILISGGGIAAADLHFSVPEGGQEHAGLIDAVISIAQSAAPGRRHLRVITSDGITNELPFEVLTDRMQDENTSADLAGPAVVAGTLSKPGEVDTFWLQVSANETWTFEVNAGTAGFDPAISIYERSASWFDPNRLERIAFNDEPLHFPGLSQEPRLSYRFEKAGRYAVSISGFAGQGGPDCVYALRITRGAAPTPSLHPPATPGWEERQFTRTLTPDWLVQVANRGSSGKVNQQPESYEAVSADSRELPRVGVPAVVHGHILKPASVQAVELKVDSAQELVLEIQTPQATMPRFNPVVRLLDGSGNEMVTNVYTKRNNNGLYMMKMIQPKATVSLRSPGRYRLEFRDITTDCAGDDFEYRVLIRKQIPHVGRVLLSEEQINVKPGNVAELHLTVEREEDFAGTVAFEVRGLPAGVSAGSGLANPVEKPPLPNGGKLERYTPKVQTSVLLLTAATDTPLSEQPVSIQIFARPVIDNRLGQPILVRELPLFVPAGGGS